MPTEVKFFENSIFNQVLDTEFFGLKVDPTDRDVIIHEPNSNDLVQLNSGLGFVSKKPGA